MNQKLIIFDFDGVLVDTLNLCLSLDQEVNENLSLEEYKSFFDGNIGSALRYDGTAKNRHPSFLESFTSKSRELIVPPSLKSIIEGISDEYILAIVSSSMVSLIKGILEKEKIDMCFKDISGSDIGFNKVVKIKNLLKKYNCDASNAVMITDTLGDIKEASECGVQTIAVTWGFHERERLERGQPFTIIDDPKDLIPAIKKVLK